MGRIDYIVPFYLSSTVIILIIRNAIKSLLGVNIGKNNEKKIKKEPSFVNKILLTYTIKYTKKYSNLCKVLVSINCIYTFLMLFFPVAAILSNFETNFLPIIYNSLKIKGIILDLPIIVFFFLATKHGKHGGVVWKFEE